MTLTAVLVLVFIGGTFGQEYSDAGTGGSWEVVVPKTGGGAVGKSLGMQAVHAVLLPSGRVLMASGSSWRNRGPLETYPQFTDPKGGQGVFRQAEDPFLMSKIDDYFQLVNNVGIYDASENTFFRIPHPVPVSDPKWPGHFAPTDLFCTGHMHVPDGNVLFIGGTQYYIPYRTGHRATYLFDWRKETQVAWKKVDWRRTPNATDAAYPWTFSGLMERGRWYASAVPTMDSRLVVIAGFVGFDTNYPEMYTFENNNLVEFFDAARFNASNPQAAWRSVDVKSARNGPFTNLINAQFQPTPGTNCSTRCIKDNQHDVFKLYEQAYLTGHGQIFLTREGDFVSARTHDTAFMRKTKATYFMNVGGSREVPTVTFTRGPSRSDNVSSYGTTIMDPNSGRIALFGGQPTSAGTFLYRQGTATGDQRYAGGRGSRKLEQFHPSRYEPNGGHWTLEPDFLGPDKQDDRTMHYALLLPTSQVLIINGANYDFYGSIRYPILLTPQFHFLTGSFLGYTKSRMNEAVEARLYHNVALLLPDGRIWCAGGGSSRATINYTPLSKKPLPSHNVSYMQPIPDTSNIDLDTEMFDDGRLARASRGSLVVPTETWVAEIYSPPYLNIDGIRRAAIVSLAAIKAPGYQFESIIGGKRFYLLHSNMEYAVRLSGLPSRCTTREKLVLIKLGSATHGWDGGQRLINISIRRPVGVTDLMFTTPDAEKVLIVPAFYMMFYVDCMGKPSVAQMVRFDDTAKQP